MFLVYTLLSLISLFKSYPTVSDFTIPLSLLPLWTHVFRCKYIITHTKYFNNLMTVYTLQYIYQLMSVCFVLCDGMECCFLELKAYTVIYT